MSQEFELTAGMGPEEFHGKSFSNPIALNRPDPVLWYAQNSWFCSATTAKNITLWKADSIAALKDAEPVVIFSPEPGSACSDQLWAPEFYQYAGHWYCYFTASNGDIAKHRMFVLQSKTDDLTGEWELAGQITNEEDGWAIDGTVFRADGRNYFIYANGTPEGELLTIAPMESPLKLGKGRTVIARPQPDEGEITEGPWQLHTRGGNFLLYSVNPCYSDDYAVLGKELTGDPMRAESWKPLPHKVLTKSDRVFGPGHCSTVQLPDGKYLLVYHAWVTARKDRDPEEQARHLFVQPLRLDENERPVLQHPMNA